MVRAYALLTALAATLSAASVVPGAYIIELEEGIDTSPVYREIDKQGTKRMQLEFKLFRGVSVQLSDLQGAEQRAALFAAMPAVRNVWPVRLYRMPSPKVEWIGSGGPLQAEPRRLAGRSEEVAHGEARDDFTPHVMTQVDKLRAQGITGKGTRIAVVDTGIDYLHPALGGCFGPGCLVSFGYDFVGDAFNGTNTPIPDSDPMDCGGHGTHVAGIVAAQGGSNNTFGFTGAAPDVTLGAYKVFGCKGEASNEVLIAAFNQAYDDGADIITSSIGGPSGWPEEPWAAAVSRIVAQGVPCTISAGNEGEMGLLYASGAADGKGVLSVASVDNKVTPVLLYRVKYRVDDGPEQPFGYAPGDPEGWENVTLPLRATSLMTNITDDGCGPQHHDNGTMPLKDLAGYVVLIKRGTCTFEEKARNAVARGAQYILFYNNVEGAIATDVTMVAGVKAAGMVEFPQAETWIKELREGRRVVVEMVGRNHADLSLQVVPNKATGGAISEFSSWGPTWEVGVKPQFSAPGGSILSTYPRAKGSYAVLSGTSMSCPLTAAVIALIGQVRGSLDPKMLETVLSATARPGPFNNGKTFSDVLAPVPQQGGGLIQAFDAAYVQTMLEPSSLSFNDTDHFAADGVNFIVTNVGREPVEYRFSHIPAITMYTLAPGSYRPAKFPNDIVASAYANITFSCETVKLGPGEKAEVTVRAVPPVGLDASRLAVWSGFVMVNGSNGTSLSLPYQGLTGSLHKSRVLGPYDVSIVRSTDKSRTPQPSNTTFVLPAPGTAWQGMDLPAIAVNPALGSPLQRVDLVPLTYPLPANATEYKGIMTIGQPAGFPSYWNTRGFNPTPWDGLLDSGTYAPPGEYRLVVRALHIFGDARNDSDWDVAFSPMIRIKYSA